MATTFYSPATETIEGSGIWFRAKCVYSTTSTATQVKVSGTVYLQHKGNAHSDSTFSYHALAGKSSKSDGYPYPNARTADVSTTAKHASWTDVKSKAFSFAVDKGTAATTVYVGIAAGWLTSEAQASRAVSVPALASYKVAYDANGGSGAPAAQTKYYGKAITLSATRPTRNDFVFRCWNTKADGSGADYAPGASYTANAALALHAVWTAIPSITSLTAERCDASGALDDEGGCALVACEWSVDATFGDTASLTGEISTAGSSRPFALSGDTAGTGGTAVAVVPDVDPEYKYVVTVTAANGELAYVRSAIISGAAFMLDFKAGGGAVGIGCPAPDEGLEVAFDADFTGAVYASGARVKPCVNVEVPWSGNEAAAIAAVPVRPCIARFSDGYSVDFVDDDPTTDSY